MKKIEDFLMKYWWLFTLMGFGILAEIFLLKSREGLVVLFLLGLWVLSVWFCKFKARVSIVAGLLALTLCPFLLIAGIKSSAEKTAFWAYIFLVVGAGQAFIEYIASLKRNR